MRRCVLLCSSFLAVVSASYAGTCSSGSLADYIALGPGSCSIGYNTFYNFQALAGSFGNTEIDPATATVTPLGASTSPGFMISVTVTASPPYGGEELMFNYNVKGGIYTGEVMTLSNASEPTDGGVTDTINYCENGTFGPDGVDGCTSGMTGGTALDDGVMNQDTFTFDPPYFLSLTDDLVITAGATDPATGGTITDQLTSVPEPASYWMTGLGILVALSVKQRPAPRN